MERKLKEIARNLDLPLSTLKRWIRQGRIPIQENGDRGIFDKTVLQEWAARHDLCLSPDRAAACPRVDTRTETLQAAMRGGRVFFGTGGNDVDAVLDSAVRVIPGLTDEIRLTLFNRLVERERLTSTGIGKGVAIPHPRTPIMDETDSARITTCFLEHPVDFGAVDDRPVFVLFLLMSPTVKMHLHLLSRLAFCVRNDEFVNFLRRLPDPEDLFLKIADFEKALEE